jgi:hypothetical protein
MKIGYALRVGLALSVIGITVPSVAHADDWNKTTILTFSQAVEISGHVLPPGSYTFKLADSTGDRNIVQIFNADGSQLITTVMAIPDYRLTPTDETVIRFREVPAGSPEVIRAWFYPGNKVGQAFVYSKLRAAQLAKASQTAVPAIAVDTTSVDELKTASVVAITPDERETALEPAMQQQTAPLTLAPAPLVGTSTTQATRTPSVGTSGIQAASAPATELPKTASSLPLVVLFGLGTIGAAAGLRLFARRAFAPAV